MLFYVLFFCGYGFIEGLVFFRIEVVISRMNKCVLFVLVL